MSKKWSLVATICGQYLARPHIYIYFFFAKKRKEKVMLSSHFSNIRRTQFDQSSPVQPVSESRGGTLSVTKNGRTDERSPNGNPCV